jgi:hypothetical protein
MLASNRTGDEGAVMEDPKQDLRDEAAEDVEDLDLEPDETKEVKGGSSIGGGGGGTRTGGGGGLHP